jgi:hypothetical protein
MKEENVKSPIKAAQGDEDRWVDVHDEALIVELGIHPRPVTPRDPSVWTKSKQEKKILRTLRCAHKGKMHLGISPRKVIPVRAKLIVQLKKNKQFPHTTYSTVCGMHQIGDVLNFFHQWDCQNKIMVNVVAKYTFNGKTYAPNERPFWK